MKLEQVFAGTLPYPPSVNHLWRHWSHGVYMTAEGKAYKDSVLACIRKLYHGKPCLEDVALELAVYFPDKRRRDLDNLLKITQDSLVYAGLLGDDKQIRHLSIWQAGVCKGGRVFVYLHKWKQDEAAV